MKKSPLVILLTLLLFTVSCRKKDAEDGVLKLKFVPVYDGQVLPMYGTVQNPNGIPMQIKRLAFFTQVLNEGASLKENGNEVALIDMSDLTDKTRAELGISKEFSMKAGNYNVLRLGIGVPARLNAKAPQDFRSTNPLSEEAFYWKAWDSYIFTKTEGALDTLKNGIFDLQFSYHTGIDEMYRTAELPKNFQIIENQTTELIVELDVKELLNGKSGSVDPRVDQNAHSVNNKPIAIAISNNYTTALKVK